MFNRNSRPTRRSFLAGSASLAAGLTLGRKVNSAARTSANEKLNLAIVGCGGRGAEDILGVNSQNIVALCDCDSRQSAQARHQYPDAKYFSDWRKLLDDSKDIDALVVATPDHNHAIVSVHAMKLGKHVYCEKPLAHSIWEARQMAQAAAENKVATQMGTQGHAFPGTREAVEVIRAGVIGEVRELHVWTDRPVPTDRWWPQGVLRPTDSPPAPRGLDWDVWLGPAPYRPYNPIYVPFKWRGRWDFGDGAIGDMGIHNADTAYWALELTTPTHVEIKQCEPAIDSPEAKECAPLKSILEINFPARGDKPPVKLHWYDGGQFPPADLFFGEPIPAGDGGSLIIGSKGSLLTRTWHGGENKSDWYVLLPRKQFEGYEPPARTLSRPQSHHMEWIEACKGRGTPLSNFGYAARLTESLLLGNVALRAGRDLDWDAASMRATNCAEAQPFIQPRFREGWSL